MALTKEDLQAIRAVVHDEVQEQLAPIKEKLGEIEEHAAVTRSATNSLVEWADTVGVITQVKFPIKKANNE